MAYIEDQLRRVYRRSPVDVAVLGEYRTNHALSITNNQAANSRLFEVRNAGSNILVPTKIAIKWIQAGNHTAAIGNSLDIFRVTGFSAVDTVNTVTLTATVKHTSRFAAAPGGAVLRGVTAAGAAAGMTGGTLTKDGNSIGQCPAWLLATLPTAGTIWPMELVEDFTSDSPLVLAANEGLIIENRVLLGAAAASVAYIDFSWAEVSAF